MPGNTKWTGVLLNHLLDLYERSSYFRTGVYSRRILYRVSTDNEIMRQLEDPDEKNNFLLAVKDLRAQRILDFSWLRYEEGNIIDGVWLCPEEAAISRAYQMIRRKPLQPFLTELDRMLSDEIADLRSRETSHPLQPRSGILSYLEEVQNQLESKKKLPSVFTENPELNRNLLRFLRFLSENQDVQLKRVVSAGLYGDSKYFEHQLKSRIVRILRRIRRNGTVDEVTAGEQFPAANQQDGELTEEELLLAYGVSRWPEVYEVCGELAVRLDDGTVLSFGKERYGAYLNSETVRHITGADTSKISNILFIENKANYVWAVQRLSGQKGKEGADSYTEKALSKISDGLLLIYHGGFFSPVKGRLFRSIILSARPGIHVWHWSDIDAGGFRIFHRLKQEVAAQAEPFLMDRDTLAVFEPYAMSIESESYLETLSGMEQDERYREFRPVIRTMMEKKIRLEQENEIL